MSLSSRKAMRQTIDRLANGEVAKRTTSKSPARTKRGSSTAKSADWTKDLFSPNPDKAWAEKFYIKYSLVWPLLFGGWAASGYHLLAGDFGNLLASILIAAPTFVVPYLYAPPLADNRQWYERFWFKYLLWLFIFTFVATYFWSEYFFDVLGMKYAFGHLKWNFDAILVGTGRQRVPLMMLFHAWYFFVTYHTCSVVFIRFVRNKLAVYTPSVPAAVRSATATILAAFFFAWAEIKFTTMESIKDQFEYGNMAWALSWGAGIYACYFVASFPMVKDLDETSNRIWSLSKTVENSLAASMIGFILLDLFCQFVVPSYWIGKEWFPSPHLRKH